MIMDDDIVVIGGGIVGLSTAMQLLERYPGRAVWVLEKEARLATIRPDETAGSCTPGSIMRQAVSRPAFAVRACRHPGFLACA
jgi:glycine/D-amino acid oxidase-like deaminating enzyme